MITAKLLAVSAGILGFLSVALGAFGAHALRDRLDAYYLGVFKTAVEYQFLHAIALLALAVWMGQKPPSTPLVRSAGLAFLIGTLFFSGSLYLLILTKTRAWGAVTPIGGTSFLIGWILVTLAAMRS